MILGIVILAKVNTTSITTSQLLHDKENVDYLSKTIENELRDLVILTTTIASSDTIKETLIDSNTYYESLTTGERATLIENLNNTWMSTNDINDPFIQARMNNNVANYLKSQQTLYPQLYGEIFLTNEYGVMLSTTGKLTTLAHYEKYWWKGAFNDGDGVIYLDDRGFDDSVEGYVLGVVVPIYDDNNNIIGMLKSNFNIDYIFTNSVTNFHNTNDDGNYYIVRTKGLIVDGNNIEPLSERVNPILLTDLADKITTSKVVEIDNEKYFVAISPIDLTYDSTAIVFGGDYESIDHTNGNLGEGWSILYLVDRNLVLGSYQERFQAFILLFIGSSLFFGFGALIIGRRLSEPLDLINDYIDEVEKNKLINANKKNHQDEITNISETFRLMVENLKNTLNYNKKLNYEKQVAQMYLDVAEVLFLVLDKKGIITLINKKGCKILGLNEEEIIGKDWFTNFLPKRIAKETKELFDEIIKNKTKEPIEAENPIVNSKGEERLIKWNNVVLYDANDKMIGILSSGEDITEAHKNKMELIRVGYEDALTNLKNRRYYEEVLGSLDTEENYPLTIVMSDINGLKLVNDAFGHMAGDRLLIEYAKLLQEICPKGCLQDKTEKSCVAARIGGDEFVLILTKTSPKKAEKIINEIRQKAEKIKIESIPLSISFGYKTKKDNTVKIQDIYRSAEDAMYREKLIEIPSMRSDAIETILTTLHEKHKNTETHSRRVAEISEKLAKVCEVNRQGIMNVKTAGLLHDIGKIVIPEAIINKASSLTKKEYELVKTHPEIGFRILNSSKDMRDISEIVLNHHERWDGKGYPRGIKTTDIPLESRIIAIADAFDAMTSERPYRPTISNEEALLEITKNTGTQFDPYLVEMFKKHFNKVIS